MLIEAGRERNPGYNRFRISMSGGQQILVDFQGGLEEIASYIEQYATSPRLIHIWDRGGHEIGSCINHALIERVSYMGARIDRGRV